MPIPMRRRMLHFRLHIDTNLVNARQKLPEVNLLARWRRTKLFLIVMSGTARDEALKRNEARRTRKTNERIFTCWDEGRVGDGDPFFKKVESALFPGGARARARGTMYASSAKHGNMERSS